jgi:FKBP-type peptidyl-prolyl cis-trans isomerase
MKTQAVVTLVGAFTITALLVGYVYWQPRSISKTPTEVANSIESAAENYPANTSPNTLQQTNELKVQGTNTMKKDEQSTTPKLPAPADFGEYEKYAADASASLIDIQVGSGAEAVSGKKVAMMYKGWLTNGELFDQSRANEQGEIEPFVFQLGAGQVIAGWDQAIVGMKEGGKRRLIIPSSVGYGETGQGPIPPKATLIFDVELLEVEK